MSNNIEFATERRINSVWTVAFRRVKGGVEILAFSRDIDLGYEEEHSLPRGQLIETDDRDVTDLVLSKGDSWRKADNKVVGEERLPIVNPGNIFSYGDGGF